MKIRLNRYLAECGIASRRKVEEYILDGRVEVNGKTIVDLAFFVEENDSVKYDGRLLRLEKKVYFLLNKPKGYITSTADEKGRKTVIELINTKQKIFPVGRLDYNTKGVLILTNDGDFANLLMHPKNKVPREYHVLLDKDLDGEHRLRLIKGITLEGSKGRFESITFTKPKSFNRMNVVTHEGRNHFVKNMFGLLGYTVKELERVSYGGITTRNLPLGSYRLLTAGEIKKVFTDYAL